MMRRAALALIGCAILVSGRAAHARTDGGDLLWQATFDLAGGEDRAIGVAAANGRVVAVGTAQNAAGNRDLVVRAHSARTGALLWSDRVDVAGGDDRALSVVMDDQRVIVAGTGSDATGISRTLIRVYKAGTGALVWTDGWPGSSVGLALEGAQLVAAGNITTHAGTSKFLVRVYEAKTGAVEWEDVFLPSGRTAGFFPADRTVALRGKTALVAAGVSPAGTFGGTACVVRAYDVRTGLLLWEVIDFLVATCHPGAIATDGRRVVLAAIGGLGDDNFFVQAYDADTGQVLWQDRTFGGSGLDNELLAVDIQRRRAFVAGWLNVASPTPGFKEAFIVRSYDTETGVLRWEDALQSSEIGSHLWHALDVDTEWGRVFAVGQAVGQGTWFVRAYRANDGALVWHDDFEPAAPGADYDSTMAVAVDHGRVFVAGTGFNAAGNTDVILRAYDAK